MILPFFLAAVLFVLFFFRIMSVQWGVQRALEDTCRLLAVTAKMESGETESEEMESGGMKSDGTYGAMVYYLLRLREYEVPFSYIQGGMLGMDCSEFSQEGNYVDLKVHYTMEVPLRLLGTIRWDMTQQARNRKWIGYDPQEDSQEGAYVYITPYGSVYHRDISCSYLNPSIHCVDIAEIEEKRNLDGSRYEICGQCGDRPGTSSYVYFTDYGEVYHCALDCGGLRRTVYRVLLEEAAGYGPCSKCGNRE